MLKKKKKNTRSVAEPPLSHEWVVRPLLKWLGHRVAEPLPETDELIKGVVEWPQNVQRGVWTTLIVVGLI